ncbi:MAG: glycosyltransferase family 2 protein, partial [Sphingomonas sp.]|nr:glycosyltransferase family 2 protein [Sphingomonas sp.]
IRFVQQQGRGKGAALRSGFSAARGDIIVMLDADGSTDPREIPSFVAALVSGADFVKGSRFLPGGGTADMENYRKLGNMAFVYSVRLLFGGRYTDLCYGYNAFWRRVLPQLQLDGDGFEIETMMNVRALKAGLIVAEVPSFESHRIYGESHLRTIPDGLRVLRTIFRERFRSTTLDARRVDDVVVGHTADIVSISSASWMDPDVEGGSEPRAAAMGLTSMDASMISTESITGGARTEAAVAR